jgi:hypothetical protein
MRLGSRLLASAAFGLALVGCHDFLVEQPEDFFTPNNFPSSEADLRIALGGIDDWYTGGSSQAYYIRGWPMVTEVPSDQTVAQSTSDSRYEQDSFTLNPSNEWLWRVWRQVYGAINQSNILIQRIPTMTGVPQDVKDRYLGAAYFHRALNHFNAVRVWGSVPLMTEPVTDFEAAAGTTRAPLDKIYAQIVSDLTNAVKLLPVKWPDSATPDDGRPTRGAANAMLADAYLNMGGALVKQPKWAEAAAAAKAVIDSKAYSLVPNFADLWLVKNKNGPEHIYSIQFQGLVRNLFTSQSRPSGIGSESGINYWYTTPQFMSSFSDQDKRKAVTFLTSVTVGSTTYSYTTFGNKSPRFSTPMPYYGKFYDNGGQSITLNSGRSDLNWPVYRYAEVLLFHAEAENEANGPTPAAYGSINAVRSRAGLPPLSGLTQAQFRDAVRQERSWELAFESKRLIDLKRWGLFYDVLSNDPVAKIGIKPFMVWAPIPQREVDLNSALGQNAGW